MANPKILEQKQVVIDEITKNVKESSSFIFLENHASIKKTSKKEESLPIN